MLKNKLKKIKKAKEKEMTFNLIENIKKKFV